MLCKFPQNGSYQNIVWYRVNLNDCFINISLNKNLKCFIHLDYILCHLTWIKYDAGLCIQKALKIKYFWFTCFARSINICELNITLTNGILAYSIYIHTATCCISIANASKVTICKRKYIHTHRFDFFQSEKVNMKCVEICGTINIAFF